jgi:small subunit ribosomal protein S6
VHHKKYELVFITNPEQNEEQLTKLADVVKELITKDDGSVETVEQWGKKRLAYAVKKQRYGYYTLFHFTAHPKTIDELELNLKHNDNIIRWIVLNQHPKSGAKPPVVESGGSYYNAHDNNR